MALGTWPPTRSFRNMWNEGFVGGCSGLRMLERSQATVSLLSLAIHSLSYFSACHVGGCRYRGAFGSFCGTAADSRHDPRRQTIKIPRLTLSRTSLLVTGIRFCYSYFGPSTTSRTDPFELVRAFRKSRNLRLPGQLETPAIVAIPSEHPIAGVSGCAFRPERSCRWAGVNRRGIPTHGWAGRSL